MSKKYSADNIQSLSAGEHVRKRPEMYFEDCFKNGTLDSLPFEVLCHAIDEYFEGNCNQINIEISDFAFSVEYNASMSLELIHGLTKAEVIMTKIGACSNQKKHLEVGAEFCRIGMAAINFASKESKVSTVWVNQKGILTFQNGKTQSVEILDYPNSKPHTKIEIKIDQSIFPELKFTEEGVSQKAKELQNKLNKLKVTVKKI
ncbi:hypothetical protein K6119_08025 [Paracrocinitomix mangrovi]|uniref:hypothetical protein n=1 Tax=Paracrocinitomix mangrovi TaxID=2862509 RepID=UPI001C8DF4CE|nr:hypothetical protein [Paracrocinitomix mangrovi]UKN03459.1 hypothetical protein K6119_08025 [Paracrocinitomix mangrovi]